MQIDPIVSTADVPFEAERLAADWITVNVPGLGVSLAAVTRPAGAGPWPAVLLLHGTHGFAQEYVRLATDLSRAGLLAVAACWFRGGSGGGTRFISPIACPGAPPRPDPLSEDALRTVTTLVNAVRILPDVLPDALGIFGHSRGGGAALNYVLRRADLQAAVLNSARYPDELRGLASELEVPLLILHGTADGPADGGTEFTKFEMARDFEKRLTAAGKSVEAVYYEKGRHNGIFESSAQYLDEVKRTAAFLQRTLR
jgi:dienelactone hydrolase